MSTAAIPGASIPGNNMLQRRAIGGLERRGIITGEVIGSALGAPGLGSILGNQAGKFGAKVLDSSLTKKAASARIRKFQ
jgi:hypothetical protein